MALMNTEDTYGSVAKLLHWLIALLVIFMLILGFSLELIPKPTRYEWIGIHKSVGILTLALMLVRVLWTFVNVKPALPDNLRTIDKNGAHGVHILLYIALILMPIDGWLMSCYAGYAPHFFNLFALPLPVVKNKAIAGFLWDIHSTLDWVIVVLVALHAAAGLAHHYWHKDNVLKRMLPCKKLN